MAGIQPAKMVGALSAGPGYRKSAELLENKESASVRSTKGKAAETVSVPLLRAVVGAHGVAGDKRSLRTIPAKEAIAVPSAWCPNPDYTSMASVKGHAMEPLVREGDIIAVDAFQTEREPLMGKLVVAANQEQGLTLSRLRRFDSLVLLDAEDRRSEPVILSKANDWRIVGKVLWWISGTDS